MIGFDFAVREGFLRILSDPPAQQQPVMADLARAQRGLAGPLRWYLIALLSVPVRATLIAAL